MSNLYMDQFEDIAWDELCLSDGYIVPHPGPGNLGGCFTPGGCLKEHVCELTNSSRKTSAEGRCIGRYVNQGREQSGVSSFMSKRRKATFEKDPWSPTPNSAFDPASDIEMKNVFSLVSDGKVLPSHGLESNNTNSDVNKLRGRDSALCDKSATIDNSSLSYLLGEIDHTSNDLSFLNNADNNDSDDFLYYGWPEIGNFEDVDKMFRDCNSTFDLGVGKEEEFGRLPSTDGLGVKPNMGGNILESTNSLKHSFPDDTSMNNTPIGCKDCFWTSKKTSSCMPSVTGTAGTDNKDEFFPCTQGLGLIYQFSPRISAHKHSQTGDVDMINETEAHSKMQNQAEGESKGHYFGNDGINHIHGLLNEVMRCSSGFTWDHTFPLQQHNQGSISNGHPKDTISCIYSDNSNMSDQASLIMKSSTIKSDDSDFTQLFQIHSTCASCQLQHMKSAQDLPLEESALAGHTQREKLCGQEGCLSSANGNIKNRSLTTSDPVTVGKYMNHEETEYERLATEADLGSLNVQESSPSNSGLDDISLEAASFLQLQLVIEQLALRTKLCIRDSLYRLAQSADQRNSCANSKTGSGNEKAFTVEGTNKCSSFASVVETSTNPLDRSVAHLLFHQSSDSSPCLPTTHFH